MQLEKEKDVKENLEKIDQDEMEEWKRSRLEKREKRLKGALGEFVQAGTEEKKQTPVSEFKAPLPPPSSFAIQDPSKKFIPPSSSGFRPPSSMMSVPRSATNYLTPASATQWAQNPANHNVTMVPLSQFQPTQHLDGGGGSAHLKRKKDDLFLDSSNKKLRIGLDTSFLGAPYFHQVPNPLLFGPKLPDENSPRWLSLKKVYDTAIIDPLTEDVSHGPMSEDFRPGISDRLPIGAAGLDPYIFLYKALQESRAALFLKGD
ncbi:hypothetical protein Ciccas_000589 [Cichlidogyrus casuarinus]|uniref:Uncharacterized protein n=1 Tax=Cichlidogyrus casuarinus TaxID=1844966 RepID=A0ABD2QMQ5_9PLAT